MRAWCEKIGLNCTAKELGSVDQADLLSQDCSNLPPFDIFCFASTVFEQMGNERCNKLVDSKSMFTSPVVFAGWKHVMDDLGFTPGANTSIKQILDVVETGKAKVWITNPTHSNSGATAYFGFLNYFAGNPPGRALTQEQLDSEQVRTGITRFLAEFTHTPVAFGNPYQPATPAQAGAAAGKVKALVEAQGLMRAGSDSAFEQWFIQQTGGLLTRSYGVIEG